MGMSDYPDIRIQLEKSLAIFILFLNESSSCLDTQNMFKQVALLFQATQGGLRGHWSTSLLQKVPPS